MAVAEKIGFDRRENTLYKRSPEGEESGRAFTGSPEVIVVV